MDMTGENLFNRVNLCLKFNYFLMNLIPKHFNKTITILNVNTATTAIAAGATPTLTEATTIATTMTK